MSQQASETSPITIRPIGVVRTPYREKYDAPRQPGALDENAVGRIVLFPGKNFEQALQDIEGFERIWVITWFHQAHGWKPKVLPPRGRQRHGMFATRSPHRPNPIGLSLCRLLEVQGRTLWIENPDLLDGTPVLDIKPYIPYAEAFPGSRTGWLEPFVRTAQTPYSVEIHEPAADQLAWLRTEHKIELAPRLEAVLRRDPLPHPYRRIKAHASGGFTLAIRSWRVFYTIEDKRVAVQRINSGFDRTVVEDAVRTGKPLHDREAHAAFHKRWA